MRADRGPGRQRRRRARGAPGARRRRGRRGRRAPVTEDARCRQRPPRPTGAPRRGATGWRSAWSRVATVAQFAAEHWGRRPLLTRAADRPDTPSRVRPGGRRRAARVAGHCGRRSCGWPRTVARSSRRSYTLGGGVGAALGDQVSEDKVLRLFADGATIVLQALHRTWAPVVEAAQELAADLGHPVQVNAYVTPPAEPGLRRPLRRPRRLRRPGRRREALAGAPAGASSRRCATSRGPTAGMPCAQRRTSLLSSTRSSRPVTACTSLGGGCTRPRRSAGTSIHLTIGVHVWTRRQLADDLLRAAGRRLDADARGAGIPPARRRPAGPGDHRRSSRRWSEPPSHGRPRRRHRRRAGAGLRRPRPGRPAGGAARRPRPAHGIRRPARRRGGRGGTSLARWEEGAGAGCVTLVTRVARVDVPAEHRDAVTRGSGRAATSPPGCRPTWCRLAVPRRPARARRRGGLRGRGPAARGPAAGQADAAHDEARSAAPSAAGTSLPAIRATRRSAMTRPISSTGWCTVVSSGSVWRHTGESSKPDDGDVLGHPQAGVPQHAHRADRHEVGRREDGVAGRSRPQERAHADLAAGLAVVTRRRRAGPAGRAPPRPRPPAHPGAGRGRTTCPADRPARAMRRRPRASEVLDGEATARAGCRRRRRTAGRPPAGRPPHTVGTPRASTMRAARSSWACSESSSTPSTCWSVR